MPDKRRAPYVSTDRSVVDLTELGSPHSAQPPGMNGYPSQTPGVSHGDVNKPNGYLPHGSTTYSSAFINGAADGFNNLGARRSSVIYPQSLPLDSSTSSFALPGGHTRRSTGSAPPQPFQSTISRMLSAPLPSPTTIKFVLLCTLWYSTSAVSSNTGKVILNNFKFPITLTIVQFFFVAAFCWLATEGRTMIIGGVLSKVTGSRALTQKQGGGLRLRKPSRATLKNTWPMAVFQVGGHIFSSMAISRVPVSTVHTIKALSPLFTVLAYALLFKISYSPATYLSLLPLTLGVMLACSFDMSASNILGLTCAFGSTLVFVSQNIIFKKLMPSSGSSSGHGIGSNGPNNSLSTAQTSAKLDKINLLFYSSGMAFLSMIPLWAYSDMPTLIALWFDPDSVVMPVKINRGAPPSVPFYFFVNGTVHFAQNLLAFAILSSTSPVTYSIASLVKRIAVICLAIIWFNQKVHPIQAAGIALTGLGLWMYNAAKRDVEKGEKKVRRMEAVKEGMLPLNRADQKILDERSETSSPIQSETGPYGSSSPSYGYADFTLPSVSHSTSVKGGFAFEDGKLNRGTQPGYVAPYPPISKSQSAPPPFNAPFSAYNATHTATKHDVPSSHLAAGTTRRRMSNEQTLRTGAGPMRHMADDMQRHVNNASVDEEVLVDFDTRRGLTAVA